MKISIIGNGRVGSTIAFAVATRTLADELVLVGRRAKATAGDALDLQHASCLTRPVHVRAGDPAATAGSDVVVLTLSAAPVTLDRRDKAAANAALLAETVPELARLSPAAVFIVVTNPVDLMTDIVLDATGLPAGQVLGTGTLIDTARLRTLLAERMRVHPGDIRAYVIGEHGPSQVAALTHASVGGAPLDLTNSDRRQLSRAAADAGATIVASKGYTNHAIAHSAAAIIEAIVHDSRTILPVSTRLTDYHGVSGVCLSVPAIIGRAGVLRTVKIRLSDDERDAFAASADVVRRAASGVAATAGVDV